MDAGSVEALAARVATLSTEEEELSSRAAQRRALAAAELVTLQRALAAERAALDARAVELSTRAAALARLGEQQSAAGGRVRLNVGGQLFDTTRAVLCAAEQPGSASSLLAALFNGRWPDAEQADGIHVDTDLAAFAHILNYLRAGRLPPPEARAAVLEVCVALQCHMSHCVRGAESRRSTILHPNPLLTTRDRVAAGWRAGGRLPVLAAAGGRAGARAAGAAAWACERGASRARKRGARDVFAAA
jgi:hypothetical protein